MIDDRRKQPKFKPAWWAVVLISNEYHHAYFDTVPVYNLSAQGAATLALNGRALLEVAAIIGPFTHAPAIREGER